MKYLIKSEIKSMIPPPSNQEVEVLKLLLSGVTVSTDIATWIKRTTAHAQQILKHLEAKKLIQKRKSGRANIWRVTNAGKKILKLIETHGVKYIHLYVIDI